MLETLVEKYREAYVNQMVEFHKTTSIDLVQQDGIIDSAKMQEITKRYEREAKINIKDWCNQVTDDENGFFAIHYACFLGQSTIIKLLYKYGAELHVRNKAGLTPVHVAAQADQAFSLQFLYSRGLDMETLDNEGQTPLHWACY